MKNGILITDGTTIPSVISELDVEESVLSSGGNVPTITEETRGSH